jgi:hypothetical protein
MVAVREMCRKSVYGCSLQDREEMAMWELEVDGAGSAEVSDLNGFSDAEYRVYIRDRQRAKYSRVSIYDWVTFSNIWL